MTSPPADDPSPAIARRLRRLSSAPVNYDPATLDLRDPPAGWLTDDRCQRLIGEPPGPPVAGGSWEIAGRLIRGYEFADPSLVRAHYDRSAPLEGRVMVLELRALNLVKIYVGVRVVAVYDELRTVDDRPARVFGWAYRTLEGHVEMGQMDWMVWKWQDTGAVEFRVRAVSKAARIANPAVAIGFRLLRGHERRLFLDSTDRRMRELTAVALAHEDPGDAIRRASPQLTARSAEPQDPAHDRLARRVNDE